MKTIQPITEKLGLNDDEEEIGQQQDEEKEYLPKDIDKPRDEVKFLDPPIWARKLTEYGSTCETLTSDSVMS